MLKPVVDPTQRRSVFLFLFFYVLLTRAWLLRECVTNQQQAKLCAVNLLSVAMMISWSSVILRSRRPLQLRRSHLQKPSVLVRLKRRRMPRIWAIRDMKTVGGKRKRLREGEVFAFVMHADTVKISINSTVDIFILRFVGERNACAWIVKP